MDYNALALELIKKMQALRKFKPHKHINESLQGETFVLHFIAHHGDDVLPSEIGHKMDVSSARIAATLNRLEEKGLITRQIDTADRRKILVKLTEVGKEIAERHEEIVLTETIKMLTALGEYDAKEYVRITGKLTEIIQLEADK